jgi:hypothetical protein
MKCLNYILWLREPTRYIWTIPSNVNYTQLVDIHVLYDTSKYGDLHNLCFGLWAVDENGNRTATFYPSNYITETYNTQFYTCFAHYIQLSGGTNIYCSAKLNDHMDYNIYANTTSEIYI